MFLKNIFVGLLAQNIGEQQTYESDEMVFQRCEKNVYYLLLPVDLTHFCHVYKEIA